MAGAWAAASVGGAGRRALPSTLRALAIALSLLCLLASTARAADSYPRLVNIYFPTLIGADLEKLARWDALVLPSRAEEWYQAELDTIRSLNPDIKFLVHMPVGYHGGWDSPSILGDFGAALDEHDWWLHDTAGDTVVPPFGFGIINMTTWCPPDEGGALLCDWLAEHVASRLGPGGRWDGVFLDLCMDEVSWVNAYLEDPVDADGDGAADDWTELNAAWTDGMRRFAGRLRELVGEDYTLVTNGNNTLYDLCDGSTREDFPNMHGDWYVNITNETYGYTAIEAKYRQPPFNIINSIWYGDAGSNGAEGNPAYERQVRYALTSTLVYGDGYFSLDGLEGGEHSQIWWHPLYDVDLGQPAGRAEPVTAAPGAISALVNGEYLRQRRFTKGIAIVNPTKISHAVTLPGTYYTAESWNGSFYPRTAAVSGFRIGAYTGAVLVGYGHVLASAPSVECTGRGEGGAVTLAWPPLPGVKGYSVYRADLVDGAAGGDTLIAVVDGPSCVDGAALDGASYRYTAAAIDSSGCEGERSLPVDVPAAAAGRQATEPGLAEMFPDGDDASYPRLANIYFPTLVGADLRKLARWDLLVLCANADEWCRDEIDTLRKLNPDIKLLAHMPVGYHGDWDSPSILSDLRNELYAHNWWMRDTYGQRVLLPFGSHLINMTSWCPRDQHGERLCDWLPGYLADRLAASGRWDGIYLDFCMDDIAWVNTYVPRPIDGNGDRLADGFSELNASWRLGMLRMVERLRELTGDDYLIVTNGNNTFYGLCDGSTRENFPNMHGDWYQNVMNPAYGYVAIQRKYRQPSVNIVNSIWYGAAGEDGAPTNALYRRQLLYGLASTLVYGNGYFSFDGLAGGEHCQAWWDPVFDVDLGQPLGRAEVPDAEPGARGLTNGELLRVRRFTNGVAVVNPTSSGQSVDLEGTFYRTASWNGQFYARTGAVREVSVAPCSGDVLVGSGRMHTGVPMIESASLEGGALKVSWEPVPGVERYSVYRVDDPPDGGGEGAEALVAVVEETCFVDRAALRGATCRYAVAVIDDSGCEGQLSRPVEVSTEPGSDLNVGLLVDTPGGQLTLSWNVPDGLMFEAVRIDARGERVPIGGGPLPGGRGTLVDDTALPGEVYDYELVAVGGGADGQVLASARVTAPGGVMETALLGCSPNPVGCDGTTISFSIGGVVGRGGEADVSLTIYDAAGRVVRRLAEGVLPAGSHKVSWHADDGGGNAVASGCYLYALESGGRRHTGKLLVVR